MEVVAVFARTSFKRNSDSNAATARFDWVATMTSEACYEKYFKLRQDVDAVLRLKYLGYPQLL